MTKETAEGVIFAGGGGALTLTLFGYPIADWMAVFAILSMSVATGFRIWHFVQDRKKGKKADP